MTEDPLFLYAYGMKTFLRSNTGEVILFLVVLCNLLFIDMQIMHIASMSSQNQGANKTAKLVSESSDILPTVYATVTPLVYVTQQVQYVNNSSAKEYFVPMGSGTTTAID